MKRLEKWNKKMEEKNKKIENVNSDKDKITGQVLFQPKVDDPVAKKLKEVTLMFIMIYIKKDQNIKTIELK